MFYRSIVNVGYGRAFLELPWESSIVPATSSGKRDGKIVRVFIWPWRRNVLCVKLPLPPFPKIVSLRPNSIFFFPAMKRLLFLAIAVLSGCTSYNNNAEGVKYFGQARYDLAVQSFQAARDADPNAADAYYNIAATYHQLGRTALQTGQAALAQQHLDYADQNYRLCLARSPNDAATYRGLAVLYMERQDVEAAFSLLQNWANANPHSAEPKIELARLYQEYASIAQAANHSEIAQTCLQSATASLQLALNTEPANARALRALGFLREQSGDYVQAMNHYRQSLQLNPNQHDLAERVAQLEKTPGLGATVY